MAKVKFNISLEIDHFDDSKFLTEVYSLALIKHVKAVLDKSEFDGPLTSGMGPWIHAFGFYGRRPGETSYATIKTERDYTNDG